MSAAPDAPPAYSSVVQSQTVPIQTYSHSPERCQDPEAHTLEFNKVGQTTGIHICSNGSTLYYVGHYQAQNTADIILYAGYDSNGPHLAQAQFIPYTKDFQVYVGDVKKPSSDDWDTVRCADEGMFKAPCYRFECRSKGEQGRSIKTRYYWKRTSDSKLGASRTSPRDYKLVDESNDQAVAVYVEHHQGTRTKRGTLSFRRVLDPKAELTALLAVLSLFERSRRFMRQVANAFPGTNSY